MKRILSFCLKYHLFYLIIFLMLWGLHQFIFMYHDDYGYATLTYGNLTFNDAGTHYSISKLFSYLEWHYNHWGGRVVSFFFSIFLLKFGLFWFRLAQSLVIFFILYFANKCFVASQNRTLMFIVLCCFFFLFPITITKESIYWASASVVYLWPFLYFMIGNYLVIKFKRRSIFGSALLFVCGLLMGWSQEQLGSLFICFLFLMLCFEWKIDLTVRFHRAILLGGLILGFGILMIAPGNFARLNDSSSTALFGKSTIEIIIMNIPVVFQKILLINKTIIYNIFLICFLLVIWISKLSNKSLIGCVVTVLVTQLIILSSDYDLYSKIVFYMIQAVHILVLMWCIFLVSVRIKKYSLIILFISAYVSILPMLVAPYFPERSLLPVLIIIIICSSILIEYSFRLLHTKKMVTILLPLVLLALVNYYFTFYGYMDNSITNNKNIKILQEASADLKNGENITDVLLYRNNNELFTGAPPYVVTYTYPWIKAYYGLPESVNLRYIKTVQMYRLNEKLFYGTNMNNDQEVKANNLYEGWAPQEDWGVWSEGTYSTLFIKHVDRADKDAVLNLKLKGYSLEAFQEIEIRVNDTNLGKVQVDTSKDGTYSINLPKAVYNDREVMKVEFNIAAPFSPSQKGESNDTRALGIGLIELQIAAF